MCIIENSQSILTNPTGIFSGLIALIVILSILTVGLRSLASLEVSYGAFDRGNGPAAQKNQ